jgi:hypothetical protein
MKIKLSTLNKIEKKATGDEIDFLIYIGQFQNDIGQVKGIYYIDVCRNIGICNSNFFKILSSVEKKGLVRVNYENENNHGLWNIDILNNIFSCEDDFKQGYLNLNYYILHTKYFYNLTKSEKIVVMHFLTRYRESTGSFNVTWDKLMEITGCKIISVRHFINHIENMGRGSHEEPFHIERVENGVRVFCQSRAFDRRDESEKDVYNRHTLNLFLKAAKVRPSQKDIKDMLILFKQYASKMALPRILEKVAYCLKEKADLIPKYINTLIVATINGKPSFG